MVKILGIYIGKERQEKQLADALYNHIVLAARQANLYGENGAPDTANGRFELIILHIFMLFRRLQDDDSLVQSVKQKTFDRFLEDMDMSLREIGVGPDGVPKRIQKMLESFYGRATAYQTAIESSDQAELTLTIARNFYADGKANDAGALALADYVFKAIEILDNADTQQIIKSDFEFSSTNI